MAAAANLRIPLAKVEVSADTISQTEPRNWCGEGVGRRVGRVGGSYLTGLKLGVAMRARSTGPGRSSFQLKIFIVRHKKPSLSTSSE
jgi:hypothetical protein